MQLEEILQMMDEAHYQKLLRAVEIGRWEEGTPLTQEQREQSLQAVLLWQSRHNSNPDHLSLNQKGEIVHFSKQQLKARLAQDDELT